MRPAWRSARSSTTREAGQPKSVMVTLPLTAQGLEARHHAAPFLEVRVSAASRGLRCLFRGNESPRSLGTAMELCDEHWVWVEPRPALAR